MSRCDNEDEVGIEDGIVVRLPPKWMTPISDDGELSDVVIATPIIYDGNFLTGSRKNSGRAILSINSDDGRVNWQWNDLLELLTVPGYKDPLTLYKKSYHQYNGLLFFTYTGSSYCLDLSKGQTVWKNKYVRHRFDRNEGFGDTYFTSGCNYEPIDEEKIYTGSISSPNAEELLVIPEYTMVADPPVNARGSITQLTAFDANGMMYLAFGIENPYKDFTNSGWGLTELNLYNLTRQRYEYKKVVIDPRFETRFIGDLLYDDSRLYFQSAKYIHSYDAISGKQLWRTLVEAPPLLSSMLLVDKKLYSAGEDRFLYCLDAQSGRLLWKEQNTGTCSELSYLNGVLYYLGGGDGLLHAVDANTGKHLWKIASPDLSKNSGAWFYGGCTAIPGRNGDKGVVVATTGLHAIAYEAIR